MTPKILLFLVLLPLGAVALAQGNSDAVRGEPGLAKRAKRRHRKAEDGPLGRFNTLYLRVGTFFPASGFANPLAAGFTGSENFLVQEDAPRRLCIGYESGKVRHFMKLSLGTPKLKLGINSGIALQVAGRSSQELPNTTLSTNGFYLVRLGLGPQLTFKPAKNTRIGVYYRPGIAAFYTSYLNEQRTPLDADRVLLDRVDLTLPALGYNGDLGLDFSFKSLSVGLCYSWLKAAPRAGKAYDAAPTDDINVYTYYAERDGVREGSKYFIPISPTVPLNRLSLTLGFMF